MTQDQIVPSIPCVYREDGYLVLTLRARAGEVLYYSTREGGKSISRSYPQFMARMQIPEPPCNPYRMMLNILSQVQIGTLRLRVREERRIVSMLEKSRDELLKLDLAKLGEEYARIVGKKPPPESSADQLVKELLMKVTEAVEKKEEKDETTKDAPQGAAPESAPAAGAAPAADAASPTPAENKEQPVTAKKKASDKKKNVAPTKEDLARYAALSKKEKGKKSAGKKDAKKPAAKKDAKKPTKKAAAAKPAKKEKAKGTEGNPFRPGSKKADLFDFHKKCGGDRAKVIEKGVALGATESTAKSWYAVFCKV